VRFAGYKQGEDLASYVAAADVMVFPSRTDTFGLVLLEAMASGVPVAAYPAPGPMDRVRNGEDGWVAEDLGEAARRALEVDGAGCRRFAAAHSWETCTEQFLGNLRTG